MNPKQFNEKATELVCEYVKEHLDKSDPIPVFDVFTVWSCATYDGHIAMLSTTLPDGMYYEVFNHPSIDKLDAYKKKKNKVILADTAIFGMAEFIAKCKVEIQEYLMNEIDLLDDFEICTIWSCKSLQNYKAIFNALGVGEPMYFEITYNGDKSEAYLDVYKLFETVHVTIDD